eukprot:5553489-Prymnesium_polylepis.1
MAQTRAAQGLPAPPHLCAASSVQVVHVGNSYYEFGQPENGYLVPSFHVHGGEATDAELPLLLSWLEP